MNEPTLTDTERKAVDEALMVGVLAERPYVPVAEVRAAVERIVAARVAEAVDRERAAWATKIETLLVPTYSSASDETVEERNVSVVYQAKLRSLLTADGTEGKR